MLEYNYFLAEALRSFTGINPWLDLTVIGMAELPVLLIPLTLIVLFLKREKLREDSFFTFFATVLGIGLSYIVAQAYYQASPYMVHETLLGTGVEDSFPSQHAATMFTFAIALLYRKRKKTGYIFLILAVLNGLARVIGGEHYPLDIAASAIIGLVAVLILGIFEEYIEKFSRWTEKVEKKLLEKLPFNESKLDFPVKAEERE
ncbi:MAG: phosphatase PAP2 family protein [Candidatus Nanohaloarchaea archaeon]